MSITSQLRERSTAEHGYLYGEYCRSGAFEENYKRALVFTNEGPFPYNPTGSDLAMDIKAESLERPVPVRAERGDIYYDAERDDYALAEEDIKLGIRKRWDGTGYNPTAEDAGAINLVQRQGQGFVLTSIGQENTMLGRYRAHGREWVNNYEDALQMKADAEAQVQKANEMLSEAEGEEDEDTDEELAKQARELWDRAERTLEAAEERLEKILKFLDLAYGKGVHVNFKTHTFGPTGEGEKSARIQHLTNQTREQIGLGSPEGAAEWQRQLNAETQEA